VDNRIDTKARDFETDHIRRKGRVAPWVIGDGDSVDKPCLGCLLSYSQNIFLGLSP